MGFLKNNIYQSNSHTIADLKVAITGDHLWSPTRKVPTREVATHEEGSHEKVAIT